MGLNPMQNGGGERAALPGAAGATREGLLAVAAVAFAESGFRAAKVREICRRAGANVAAVNYHFGGKEALYLEVLRRSLRDMLERHPVDGGVPADAPAGDRLRGFVRSFLSRTMATGRDACFGRLLARELMEPTPALDVLVASEIRHLAGRLEGIVGDLLGPGAAEGARRICVASVVGQIVFYQHCRPVVSRLFPDLDFAPAHLDRLAEHITRFSLAGIREVARGAETGRAGEVGGRRKAGKEARCIGSR